jgi:hypothetical protein
VVPQLIPVITTITTNLIVRPVSITISLETIGLDTVGFCVHHICYLFSSCTGCNHKLTEIQRRNTLAPVQGYQPVKSCSAAMVPTNILISTGMMLFVGGIFLIVLSIAIGDYRGYVC